MSLTMSRGTPFKKVYFYFKQYFKRLYDDRRNRTSRAIALNIFSFIAFFAVENSLFRFIFDLTFKGALAESLAAREFAAYVNTVVAILLWPDLARHFKAKFTQSRRKWVRTKWEEVTTVIVKLTVNAVVYIKAALILGQKISPGKVALKVIVVVTIAIVGANLLENWLLPRCDHWIFNRILPFLRTLLFGKKVELVTEPVFEFKPVVQTGKLRIVSHRVHTALQEARRIERPPMGRNKKELMMQEA